jgi:hypothetical protein
MKKLITVILCVLFTLNIFGQDAYLDHSYVEPSGFAVNDTITVKFNPIYVEGTTPTQLTGWFEYNNKLLEKISETYYGDGQVNSNHWVGYKFNPATGFEIHEISSQWGNGASYGVNADWNVMSLFVQSSGTIVEGETFIEIKFKIKDRGLTDYTDYSEVTMINDGRYRDNRTDTDYVVHAMNQSIDLGIVSGVNAGDVVINLNSPAKALHATDYQYKIYNGDIIHDEGSFDSNGQIIISTLINDIEYNIDIFVTESPTTLVLDDVITITDAYITFKEAIARDGGSGGAPGDVSSYFSHGIQYLLGELNNSGNVDFEDSYISLAHVNGVDTDSEWYSSTTNGAINVVGEVAQYGISTNDYYFGQKKTFTPTDDLKVFEFAHGLVGDVDFSHSYEPTAVSTSNKSSTQSKVSSRVETQTIDIVSELTEGKVIVSILTDAIDMVGSQFNITYDTSILTLDEVIFDTGNTMSNFSNHKETVGKIWIGSLDQSGIETIKNGTPYKLIFTPKETIQNTIGLVSFNLTEGVKSDGTKIKFEF